MAIMPSSHSATPTSYIKIFSYGMEDDNEISPLETGIESTFKTIGKYILEQNEQTQETLMTPGYFFYLAKHPKKIDPKYGTGGAIVVKAIDNTVSNEKIRKLVASNRIVLSIGGTGQNFQIHQSKGNEFKDFFVNDEDRNYKWVIIKTKIEAESPVYMKYAIQEFKVTDMNDFNSGMNDLLRFRNIIVGGPQRPMPGLVAAALPAAVSTTAPTSVSTSTARPAATSSTTGSKGSKKKEEEKCIIS